MCNLSAGIREEGRIEGKSEGKLEEIFNSIKNMIKVHFDYQVSKDLCVQKVIEMYPSVDHKVIINMANQIYR